MLFRALSSPKRSGARRNSDLYYYYAAFSQPFIEQKILDLDLPIGSVILDPWCGSGTTLAAARKFGHSSFGCDINPVSLVLTKSRFASYHDAAAVIQILEKALSSLSSAKAAEQRPEVLLWTLRDRLLGYGGDCSWSVDRYESIQPRTALLLTALFFFARQAAREARSKNPSWRKGGIPARLSLTQLKKCYGNLKAALTAFQLSLAETSFEGVSTQVVLINSESEEISAEPIADAVITSPPYLTRLDYGVSTGLEWRLLKGDPTADMTDWRSTFTGSVLTFRSPHSAYALPHSVSDLLRQIHKHPSKAAQTYYFQFFKNYFVGIQNSIGNISNACKIGAKGLFVVQDSQFKDLNVPLTTLFSDILIERGWAVDRVEPFSISPTFYRINSKRWTAEDFVRSENLIWARRVK